LHYHRLFGLIRRTDAVSPAFFQPEQGKRRFTASAADQSGPQLTACIRWPGRMNTAFRGHDRIPVLGVSATNPIEPLRPRLAALLRLAGSSLLRCRAYPDAPATAHSGASNCGFQV